jgi:hypothetical protein
MDISVSRLNGRLASKLPPELPLGLVFVTGIISQLHDDSFVLAEGAHYLHCRIVGETQLRVGDEVRASGHLMFDSGRLQYFLLARDIEVIKSEPLTVLADSPQQVVESEALLAALAAVKARAAAAPIGAGEKLPVWVRKLEPPELRGESGEEAGDTTSPVAGRTAVLDEDLLVMLSAAMDSEEELELTPELLAPYLPDRPVQQQIEESGGEMGGDTAVAVAHLPTSYRPVNREETDWLVILLIISFFVLTIAAIVTIILLVIQ